MATTAQTWDLPAHARAGRSSPRGGDARSGERGAKRARRPAREGGGAAKPAASGAGGFARADWLAILLLVLACVLVYANTVGNQFVWDDRKQILENDLIKEPRLFGRAMVSDVWAFKGDTGEPWSNYWRPVFVLWLIGNYRAFGLESTAGWHVANIALHALVVALAYFFLRRLGLSRLLSLAVMLPYTVHPIHVESVSWISGSPDMLVSSGLLAALILLLGRTGGGSRAPAPLTLALSLAAFALSLLSKEITIFFPAIIFVAVFLTGPAAPTRGARAWAAAKRTLPFVVLTGVYAVAHYKILGKAQISVPWHAGPAGLLLTAPRIFFYYLREAFFPLWIAPAYPVRLVTAPDAANFLLPALVVVPFLAGLFWLARRDAVRGIGLAIFLVPLAPAFNINAFAPDRIVADRYLYLPLLGLLMILVPSLAELVGVLRGRRVGSAAFPTGGEASVRAARAEAGGAPPDLVTFWIFAAAAALLGVQTIRYNTTWKSELTLWTAAVAADPSSVSALNEYGLLMFEAKNYAEARRVLDRALSLTPLTTAYLLRADVATAEKRYADAEKDVKTVLASYSDNAGAYERLALVYQSQNRLAEAEATLRTAIVSAPHRRGTFTDSLGVVLYLQGRRDEALKVLEDGRAVARTELDPGAQGILFHLGMLYSEMGRTNDARAALEEYLRATTRSVEPTTRALRQQASAALTKLPR